MLQLQNWRQDPGRTWFASSPRHVMKFAFAAIILSFGGFVLLNGYYALRWPMQFLSARWTAKRGLTRETSRGELRSLGVVFIAIGLSPFGWACVL
jgi:hypothetical protein